MRAEEQCASGRAGNWRARLFDLDYVVREAAPEEHGFTEARRVVAFSYANSLRAVWKQVRERLLEDHRKQRPLHSIRGLS